MKKGITALIIMDGFGIRTESYGNAIKAQGTPCLDSLTAKYPHTQIGASGMDVGLPNGQMGNSEVGHVNIGAGRVVYQELTRISKSIMDGDFFTNKTFLDAIASSKANSGKLHLIGLLSDGGVHSHIEHAFALIKLAKMEGLENVFVHCLMDGRDVPPSSGLDYVLQLEAFIESEKFGAIATVSGRYWAMDRDNRWDRVERAYNALSLGKGDTANSAAEAMQNSYDKNETDEFVSPTVIMKNGEPVATIDAGDSVIFFNFRPDRTRELTRCFIEPDFSKFNREGGYKPVNFVSITQYDATFKNISIAYTPQTLENTLGEYVASKGIKQLRIAETEKYAHVTFFFNGGVEAPYAFEDRALIPSPKVATYDLKPEMSAYEVTDEAIKRIQSGEYGLMVLNFANCDMVGHTTVMKSTMAAVKTVDECVKRIVDAVIEAGGSALVTADHGNADMIIDPTNNEPFTAHTTNLVPFIYINPNDSSAELREDGKLADIAPTILKIMGLPQPIEMTGVSIIK